MKKVHLPYYIEKQAQKKSKRVVIFSGSARAKNNCPGQDGKTLELARIAAASFPDEVDVELIDLAVREDNVFIMPCKACISTAGGYHCHFPCSCYGKGKENDPVKDLMYEEGVYQKLLEADAFMVFSPINWYAVSTQVKALFDRLVCISGTLPADFAMKELGKDIKKTTEASKQGLYDSKLKNWFEGKYAAFFVHGDDGADDFKRLPPPDSFDRDYDRIANDPKKAIMPIVATCRYSGIFVPEDLIVGMQINKKISYAEGNERFQEDLENVKLAAEKLAKNLLKYISG
jgi:multimeric flavodoxin WrbA